MYSSASSSKYVYLFSVTINAKVQQTRDSDDRSGASNGEILARHSYVHVEVYYLEYVINAFSAFVMSKELIKDA
jgi:hypothetical protein